MHTIPIIPIIHTTYTIHMQHNCHTYHTYNSKHTCHTYHTYHTSILSKHAIPDRPYTPYIPNIPYHTPTTPQGGRGTVPHPHHTTGGEGEDLNMGPIPCGGGEGGGGRAWCIYTPVKQCVLLIKHGVLLKAGCISIKDTLDGALLGQPGWDNGGHIYIYIQHHPASSRYFDVTPRLRGPRFYLNLIV